MNNEKWCTYRIPSQDLKTKNRLLKKVFYFFICSFFGISNLYSRDFDINSKKFNIITKDSVIHKYKYGENILHDAKELLYNKSDLTKVKNIEKAYGLTASNFDNDCKFLFKGIFFSHLNFFYMDCKTGKTETSSSNGVKKYKILNNIAKADVTNFATGMARFLADRAKQELNESFFLQMRKQMVKIPELQVYFPESYLFLHRVNSYNMHLDLDHLRNGFNQDVQKLPSNIYRTVQQADANSKYKQLSHLKQYFNEDTKGMLVGYAIETVLENQGKINPKELLYKLAHSPSRINLEKKLDGREDVSEVKNAVNTIKLAELISNSLLSADTNRYWAT